MKTNHKKHHHSNRNKKYIYILSGLTVCILLIITCTLVTCLGNNCSNQSGPSGSKSVKKCDIYIDAGHGGKDAGSSKSKRLEKDDNLALATEIYKYLDDKGISVGITRSSDTFISLSKRKSLAEKSGCKIFISIHRNSCESNSAVGGAEAWIHSSNPADANNLAASILSDICNSNYLDYETFENRGVKTGTATDANDNYAMNKVSMNSLILEMGFISNKEDNKIFDKNMKQYAKIIGDNLAAYIELKQ